MRVTIATVRALTIPEGYPPRTDRGSMGPLSRFSGAYPLNRGDDCDVAGGIPGKFYDLKR